MKLDSIQIDNDDDSFDEESLRLVVTLSCDATIIKWSGFDMPFDEMRAFLAHLKSDRYCSIGGGGNSSWSLGAAGKDTCTLSYEISGSGGDSRLQIELPKNTVVEIVEKICEKIDEHVAKHVSRTRF
jgi:hypothetical protein